MPLVLNSYIHICITGKIHLEYLSHGDSQPLARTAYLPVYGSAAPIPVACTVPLSAVAVSVPDRGTDDGILDGRLGSTDAKYVVVGVAEEPGAEPDGSCVLVDDDDDDDAVVRFVPGS